MRVHECQGNGMDRLLLAATDAPAPFVVRRDQKGSTRRRSHCRDACAAQTRPVSHEDLRPRAVRVAASNHARTLAHRASWLF